jgi:hypothetical protein
MLLRVLRLRGHGLDAAWFLQYTMLQEKGLIHHLLTWSDQQVYAQAVGGIWR